MSPCFWALCATSGESADDDRGGLPICRHPGGRPQRILDPPGATGGRDRQPRRRSGLPVPGAAPISPQRQRMLTPHHGLVLNEAVLCGGSGQLAILGGVPLSAVLTTPFPAAATAPPNPHRPRTACHFPRVSSEAFGRRPLLQSVSRARPASETLHESGHSIPATPIGEWGSICGGSRQRHADQRRRPRLRTI
jgi:hypothetical protein